MEQSTKYTVYLGLNDKDTKKQEIATVEAYKLAQNIIKSYADGATIYEATGIYTHEDGEVTIEKSLRIEVFCEKEGAENICKDLKRAFNQESVILQKEVVKSESF